MTDESKTIQPVIEKPLENGESKPDRQKVTHVERHEVFAGPLPPPEILYQYNRIIPDGADRILSLVEKQQSHRMYLEKTVIEADVKRSNRGLIFGFIIAIVIGLGGMILIAMGSDVIGLTIVLGEIITLVGVFVYSQKTRQNKLASHKENTDKEPQNGNGREHTIDEDSHHQN